MKTSKPSEADAIIQKAPSDLGIHRTPRKGTLNAPEKILEGLSFEKKVLVDEVFPDEFSLEETQRRIQENTRELAEYGKPIVTVGGDHSVSYPALKALKQRYPDLKLVWLDAHLDVKEKIDDHVSHDVLIRQLVEEEAFKPREITFAGITEIDHDEREFIENHGFQVLRPSEVEELRVEGPVYLSVDIDALTQEEAPGTGYPHGELPLEQVLELIRDLRPVHADLVEVAPPLDSSGRTVENARKVLEALVHGSGRALS